ncbi:MULTISPECIES: carbon-nitrogen hydrolase family protein [Halomonas]|uniref:carbon-nitrogen hydrolase family protein n=1 Tax=Halomonas TaxID=2745 RepID=UPI001C961B36|nr:MULTISPECIES: carbon-nitrogen hydrolase family protein [Halomonas]MBY6027970.1 carbon-nitrogen hydrolase family protein [Halomonas sp. DP8Y7-1]MBY6206695.1 carbon-nitrogen hydrolase family protein [Halomonas sp. DP3Y7-2]MBY6230226.1 carbon-nitrogen hydrolase family protein [Halomonas sp. DP3Y7-1]MCA0918356.1 carbon-nitrogen hydrolase family protein [Halomonas denitrificans]
MRLMLAQTDPVTGDIAANLSTLEGLCRQAEAAGADLLALPELALTGYNVFDRLDELADEGALVDRVASLARQYHLHVLFGLALRQADGRLTNSAVLLDDEGHQLACYHKRQLWDREHRYFAPGDELCVVDTRLGKLGLMICYDNEFPEMARALAQAGAEVILSPTANMVPNADRQQLQIRARAMDNQRFVACINRSGVEDTLHYCGNSLVAGPDGEVLGRLGNDAAVLVVDLDLERIHESRVHQDYLKDLRPLKGHCQ